MSVPNVTLNNGRQMPVFGLGTWRAEIGVVGEAVKLAIDAGYRHFDCAYLYSNEREIGKAIKEKIAEGVVKREDLFITSKLWNTFHRPDLVVKSCQKSLNNFGLDYLDLYLIHFPIGFKAPENPDENVKDFVSLETVFGDQNILPKDENGKVIYSDDDYVDTYREMEKCVELGLTKSIGISNFNTKQIARVLSIAKIKPVTNQVELHPYLIQTDLRDFCKKNDIVITAYSPLGRGNIEDVRVLDDPEINAIAKEISKSPAQVILRYLIQLGVVVIPKSTNPDRLRQNLDVFNFELSPELMTRMKNLDRNKRFVTLDYAADHIHYPF